MGKVSYPVLPLGLIFRLKLKSLCFYSQNFKSTYLCLEILWKFSFDINKFELQAVSHCLHVFHEHMH